MCDKTKVVVVQKIGLEVLLNLVDIFLYSAEDPIIDLLLDKINFNSFVENNERKFPFYNLTKINDNERIKYVKNLVDSGNNIMTTLTQEDSLELLQFFFNFIKISDNYDFWWKFFRKRFNYTNIIYY